MERKAQPLSQRNTGLPRKDMACARLLAIRGRRAGILHVTEQTTNISLRWTEMTEIYNCLVTLGGSLVHRDQGGGTHGD